MVHLGHIIFFMEVIDATRYYSKIIFDVMSRLLSVAYVQMFKHCFSSPLGGGGGTRHVFCVATTGERLCHKHQNNGLLSRRWTAGIGPNPLEGSVVS